MAKGTITKFWCFCSYVLIVTFVFLNYSQLTRYLLKALSTSYEVKKKHKYLYALFNSSLYLKIVVIDKNDPFLWITRKDCLSSKD